MKINVIEVNKKDNIIISVSSNYPKEAKKKAQSIFREMKQRIDNDEDGMIFTMNNDVELTVVKTK